MTPEQEAEMKKNQLQTLVTLFQMSMVVLLIIGGSALNVATEILAFGVAAITGGSDLVSNKIGARKQ